MSADPSRPEAPAAAPAPAAAAPGDPADRPPEPALRALLDEVELMLGEHGPLARQDPGHRRRPGQLDMARAVAQAIVRREALVVEAGTGVGKTYAYLLPALLSGVRTLVSTATKSLQDQLHGRDLPRLLEALGLPHRTALLKGRGSYLCRHRLDLAGAADLEPRLRRTLDRVQAWAQATVQGDLAELTGLDEGSPLWPWITSTRDNCLGSECPRWRECHVVQARREALAADLVVVNHHLFFADLALRDTGMAELLPTVELAVFDEAHQLPEAGVSFLGRPLASAALLDLARDLRAAGLGLAPGLQPWDACADALDHAARELALAAAGPLAATPPAARSGRRLRWEERAEAGDFLAALGAVGQALAEAVAALDAVREAAPDFPRLVERAQALQARALALAQPAAPAVVRWIELSGLHCRLAESPLDIREALQAQLEAAPRAWVFTSATLGTDEALSWFCGPAGLSGRARTLRVTSPFDHARQARLYVPTAVPRPGSPEHLEAVAELAGRCALAAGGRTVLLTTTRRAMQALAERLRGPLGEAGVRVLVQGEASKRELLARFQAGPPALLIGSASLWEGVDLPGEVLQCVVIDKLPFPPPDDPLVEARVRRLEAEGGDGFRDLSLPEAAVALKQGAGRLIRREDDRGLLVIADPRLVKAGYGRRLLAALPPMERLGRFEDALVWLGSLRDPAGLTRAATTDAS